MSEVEALAGKRMVSYFRLLENASKEDAEIVPLDGDSSISFKRDSKSTATKSGNINTSSGLTAEIDQTFYEGISKVSDQFYDAILDDKIVEYYDFVLHICHIDLDWYDGNIVTVVKNNNISSIKE